MAAKGMKGLLAWCKKNTAGYRDVNVTNMSSSWKDGLAFCALLHKFHPELIDFDSLSKENVLYNNKLAFDIAEGLGIAPFLDAEDMANMKAPDRLSVMTYLSQYFNFFKDCKPVEASDQHAVVNPVNKTNTLESPRKSKDENLCLICGKKVHLVQRYFEDGKLYHRTCHRNSSLDKIRGKNYFIHRESNEKATNAVVDLAGGKSNPQNAALLKVDTVDKSKESKSLKVSSGPTDVDAPAKGEQHENAKLQNEPRDESNKTIMPLPKPRVKTLPTSVKKSEETTAADASQSASDDEYDYSLNPFGSGSEDEDTLSSTSSEEDTNPFGPSTSTADASKSKNVDITNQESESENEGNPFGDDDIDEVESEGHGNPFGDCDEESRSSPTTETKLRQPERFNPFSKESIDEETATTKHVAPVKKPPPRPEQSPSQKPQPKKSHKKAPAPPPPTRKNETSEKMVKMNRENERDTKFPHAKSARVHQRPLSPMRPSQKLDRFKLRRLSTPKSRAAPGYGHPLVKRKVHIKMNEQEITTELKVIDIKLTDYETKGVKLEEMLRYAMNKEVEWTKEEDELLNEWFDLVNKKNMLLRDESDLVFQLQQQKLEQEHADIEFELRKLLNKPDSAKTEKDKQDEEELLQKLVEVVESRNVIINSIEEERVKEAEEDSMYEQMKWMREHPNKKKKKNKVKKMFSKKEKKEKASGHS